MLSRVRFRYRSPSTPKVEDPTMFISPMSASASGDRTGGDPAVRQVGG